MASLGVAVTEARTERADRLPDAGREVPDPAVAVAVGEDVVAARRRGRRIAARPVAVVALEAAAVEVRGHLLKRVADVVVAVPAGAGYRLRARACDAVALAGEPVVVLIRLDRVPVGHAADAVVGQAEEQVVPVV